MGKDEIRIAMHLHLNKTANEVVSHSSITCLCIYYLCFIMHHIYLIFVCHLLRKPWEFLFHSRCLDHSTQLYLFEPKYDQKLRISPVYNTTLPPCVSLVAVVMTLNRPPTDSSTEVGASPMPKICAALFPMSVWTKPGSKTKALSHSSSALILTPYQFTRTLDGPYAAFGTGGCLLQYDY